MLCDRMSETLQQENYTYRRPCIPLFSSISISTVLSLLPWKSRGPIRPSFSFVSWEQRPKNLSPSQQWAKVKGNKGLKKKIKAMTLTLHGQVEIPLSVSADLKSRTDNHTKSEGRLTVAKPADSLIREAFLFSFWQRGCAWRCQSLQHLPQLVWCQTWYPCLGYSEWGNGPWLSMCPRLIQSFLDFFS